MRINTNVAAMISNNALQKAQSALSNSIKRLSSGYKINSSADDPAGCAISEKMRVQIKGLDQANNNTSDGISVISTAEGAITEIQSMLTRMKELTVQAANDVNQDDERAAIQAEIDQINSEIDRISNQTEFNTQALINGNLSRRVYSDVQGVKQNEISDGYTAGIYGITVTEDARQAIAVSDSPIAMSDTDQLTKEQVGSVTINGYAVNMEEGDDLNTIKNKLVTAMENVGGKSFNVEAGDIGMVDTTAEGNGLEYAGYKSTTQASGSYLVFMTNGYGREEQLDIRCSNEELANLLGITSAYSEDGSTSLYAEGSDVKATLDDKDERVGFANSAVLSTKGTVITVKDVNNKVFVMDVPGNTAGTKFDDTQKVNSKSVATSDSKKDVNQEVTDIGRMSIHVGANENQVIIIDIPEVSTYALGTDRVNVMTSYNSQLAIQRVDEAVQYANKVRSRLGAYENRFEHTTNNLDVSSENMTKALSVMIDTDMAEEMTEYTSQTVLTQAATSILSQANQRPSEVLQLLQR